MSSAANYVFGALKVKCTLVIAKFAFEYLQSFNM